MIRHLRFTIMEQKLGKIPNPELEPGPEVLKIATKNNFGLDVRDMVTGLGFIIVDETRNGNFVLVNTPKKLLGMSWSISYIEKEKDPNLFTIYLDHGGDVGYMDFLIQRRNERGEYFLFTP